MKKQRFKVIYQYGPIKEVREWLHENGIKSYSWYSNIYRVRYISFKYEEDAMAFKLAWL